MSETENRGEQVRQFILDSVAEHPNDIARITASHFGITRQAVNKHLQRLVAKGMLVREGRTRNQTYSSSRVDPEDTRSYALVPGLLEDVVWSRDIAPSLQQLPDNVLDIWNYGFSEIFNNAIDHSEGAHVYVALHMPKISEVTRIVLLDDGIGIFRKIQLAQQLPDERHAALELAKGKMTTDPVDHTGEGIFFTSRMFDGFYIASGEVSLRYRFGESWSWVHDDAAVVPDAGTRIVLQLGNHVTRTAKEVFDQYASGDDGAFAKTVIPVELAQYGGGKLVSRSQAKRLLTRVDMFRAVIFDFRSVETIGPSFADEIFRVFANRHPEIEMMFTNAAPAVERMIVRARNAKVRRPPGEA